MIDQERIQTVGREDRALLGSNPSARLDARAWPGVLPMGVRPSGHLPCSGLKAINPRPRSEAERTAPSTGRTRAPGHLSTFERAGPCWVGRTFPTARAVGWYVSPFGLSRLNTYGPEALVYTRFQREKARERAWRRVALLKGLAGGLPPGPHGSRRGLIRVALRARPAGHRPRKTAESPGLTRQKAPRDVHTY